MAKCNFINSKKTLKKLLSLCISLVLLFLWAPEAHMGSTNQVTLTNPDFESGDPPTGWTIYSGTWGTHLSKATNHKLGGSYSLKVNDTSSSAGYGMRSAKVTASAYATYAGYVAAYAESGVGQLYLEFWDDANNRLSVKIAGTGSTGKWKQLRAEARAPAGTKYASLLLYGHNSNVGVCYYDTARLIRIDEVPQFENPGFEGSVDSNGEPSGWNVYDGNIGTQLFVSTERAYEGSKSFKITDNNTSQGYGLRSVPMAAAGGFKYEAGAWLNNVSGTGQIYLEFWRSSVNNSSDTRLGTVIGSSTKNGQWEKVSVTGTAPSGTEYITVLLYSSMSNTGTSYYDYINAGQYYDSPSISFTPQVSGHPRLFFTPSELTALKAKKTDTSITQYGVSFSEIWSTIKDDADKYLNETSMTNNLTTFGSSVTYPLPPVQPDPIEDPPGFTGFRYPYWSWMGSSLQIRIEALAYAYKISDDIRYGNKAKQYALAIADWDTWTDPTDDFTMSCMDSSYITKALAEAYDICYELFTEAERNKLAKAIYEKGIRPIYKDLETKVDQNINILRASALGTATAAFLGEQNFYDVYMYRAYDYLNWYLDLKNTSTSNEGFGYTSFALNYVYQGADHVARVTGRNAPFTHPYTTNSVSRMLVDFISPNGWGMVNFSDTSIANHLDRGALILSGRGDGLAGWYVKETKMAKYGRFIAYNYLSSNGAFTSPEQAGLPDVSLANTDIGYLSMRTGWEPDSQLLALYSGPSNLGHNQYDDNSFVYNAGGEWLLTDPGYINLSSSAKQTFTTGTVGHNSMLVNGTGQSDKNGGFYAGSFCSPVFDLGVGDATGSYTTSPDVSNWKRKIFNVKPDYYLIHDYVSLTGSGIPEILLHGDLAADFTSGGTPLAVGNTLPANFTIEKPRASVGIQSLRPSNASRLYTRYAGAEIYGTYGSIKTASPVSSECFVTLLRPRIHKQGIIEAESLMPPAASGGSRCTEALVQGYNIVNYISDGTSGDYVTYNFNVPASGQYNFKIGLAKQSYGPIVNIRLDGVLLQSGVNTYCEYYDLLELTYNRNLAAGTHSIKFEIAGKDSRSFGHYLYFDYLRLLGVNEVVQTAQPYTVNTATSGTVTGLAITLDSYTTDQVLLNPMNTSTYTTGNLTLVCRGTQGMMRKTTSGIYKRYAIINTLTTGTNLTDGALILTQNLGTDSAIGIGVDESSGKWLGTIRMGSTGSPTFYVPSVTQVIVDGSTLNSSQYSYNSISKLLTLNSVPAGDHNIEVTP